MNGEIERPVAAGLSLSKRSLLRLEGTGQGAEVRCFSGALWVTQEGDFEDHFLDPGEKFVINREGLVVVQALADARVGIEQGNEPCLLDLTLVK